MHCSADRPPVVVAIGYSDCSGTGGVIGDTKTFCAFRVYGACVVTGLAAQTASGMQDTMTVPEAFIREQLEAVSGEFDIAAVKIGLCTGLSTIRRIARWLREHPTIQVVVDPVVVDAHAVPLLQPEELEALRQELLPRATVVTPNRVEAAFLCGYEEVVGQEAAEEAARTIFETYGPPTVVTGAGLSDPSLDVLVGLDGVSTFSDPHFSNRTIHGSGSSYASAIAACLARGDSLREAIDSAKAFVSRAIAAGPQLGTDHGYLWHQVGEIEPNLL